MIKTLKKKVWKLMSQYVRLRDCLKTTGTLTRGHCYTCGRSFSFKELQAGHVLDGRCGTMIFDERGLRAQCAGCNVFLHGNKEEFIPKFIDECGIELLDELKREKRTPKNWKESELKELEAQLQDKIAYIEKL